MSKKEVRTIGVLTSGGDAPGMNAAIRAVVRTAINKGLKVKGIMRGYAGLLQEEIVDMDSVSVADSTYRGTYLLPPVLKRFRALYPKVHVEICEMDSIDLEDQLLEGLLDLALIAAPPVRIRHGVSPFMRDEIMIVTTADHPVMEFAGQRL